jgi:hypothetical protein
MGSKSSVEAENTVGAVSDAREDLMGQETAPQRGYVEV